MTIADAARSPRPSVRGAFMMSGGPRSPMVAATLFSGIGAPECAMPHWHWPWHAEIEKFPSAVMAARHPNSINLGDVTADDFCERAAAIARPDIIIFGSPCQDFSIAGKRLGLDGARGNMALTGLRIVAQLEPTWFCFENVPGLLSNWSGAPDCPPEPGLGIEGVENSDFAAFLGTVDELGYSGAWASLDAQYRGVAQRRERVFFVGHIGDWRHPAAVLLEPESLCGNHPPSRETGKGIAPTIASRPTGGGGLGTDFDCDGGLIASHDVAQPLLAKGNSSPRADAESYVAVREISHYLNAGGMGRIDYETETLIAHALRADGFDASEDGTGRGTPIVPIAFDTTQITSKTNRCHPQSGDPCHPLAARAHAPAIAFDCKASGRNGFGTGDIAPTLRAMNSTNSHPNDGGQVACFNGAGVRRLTPRECERLQSLEDDYTLIAYRGKPAADGPRYKSLGNSMNVEVMRWILSRIELANPEPRP